MGHWFSHIILLLGVSILPLQAQNLVPNPGFEDFFQCPPYLGQILEAKHWDSPNNTTSDFFHRCADVSTGASIPENLFGVQEAASGNGYAGIRTWIPSTNENTIYREYLSTRLTEPLQAERNYHISFQLSVAEEATHVSDDIGIFLSPIPFDQERVYPVNPAIINPEGNLLVNTDSWVPIEGTYPANGGEEYLLLGNFLDDNQITLQPKGDISGQSEMVYYYIDDILIRPCETPPSELDIGTSTLLCLDQRLSIELDSFWEDVQWQDGSNSLTYMIKEKGRYVVSASYDGCQYKDSLEVTSPSFLGWALEDTSLCPDDSLLIEVPMGLNSQVIWQDGSSENPYLITDAGTYSFTISENSCSQTDTFEVSMEIPSTEPNIEIDTFFCSEESLIYSLPTGEGFVWLDGYPDERRIIDQAGNYIAVNPGLCYEKEISLSISEELCKCEPFIPNVFSPNNDGIHDSFHLESHHPLDSFQLKIMNRWGKEVFRSKNIRDEWNGRLSSNPLPEGIYFWSLRYSCSFSSRVYHQAGSVILIR